MTLSLKQISFIGLCVIGFSTSFAQSWFSNELGVMAGPVAFQSDFGERGDFETNIGNIGYGIGLIHFMNFEYTSGYRPYSYFRDHFKVRSEISWNKTKLQHFGKWVDDSKTSAAADKLRAHSGEANNFDIGMQLEYFPFSLKEFSYSHHSFAPFISLGVHLTTFNPKAYTTYGDGNSNNLNNYYDPWHLNSDGTLRDTEFINTQGDVTLSVVGSIGTRYKLTFLSDLMIDLRVQYFFKDTVDGLNHTLPSNKNNDYLLWLNFGYIHYFN